MRVLQLVAQTRVGGAETFGLVLGEALARRGHSVLLLANRDNGPLLERELPAGMEAHALRRSSRLDPRILPFLAKSVLRFRPDVIHAHNYEASVWGRLLGLLVPGAAVIVHVHSSRFVRNHGRHRILTDRVLFERADRVIVLNPAQEEFLLRRIGLPADKLARVANGIDAESFARPSPRERGAAPTVVCVASLTDVKGHDVLLAAWGRVAAELPAARLVLVGDGPLRAELEATVTANGLSGTVRFSGEQRDVRPSLWDADLFVLPSRSEALPLSVLEAMASGLPVVASEVGALPVVVSPPARGLLVPPGDPDSLAAALLELLRDPTRAARMGEAGTREVVRQYGMDRCAGAIESIYESALRRRAGDLRGDPVSHGRPP